MKQQTKRRPEAPPYGRLTGMRVGSITGALAAALIAVPAGYWPGLLVIGAVAGGLIGFAHGLRAERKAANPAP